MKYIIVLTAIMFGCVLFHGALKSQSMRVGGYYGVMGGEPPQSFGFLHAGAYSFSMGFRRLPN